MAKAIITHEILMEFKQFLYSEEKSVATIEKYLRDARAFQQYAKGQTIRKELLIAYKKFLCNTYAPASVNSMLASLHRLLAFMGLHGCKVRLLKVQKRIYCSDDQELSIQEYRRLVQAAKSRNNERLQMILQTLCATGARVSELKFFTVEALASGRVSVSCKGKLRTILLPLDLRSKLSKYVKRAGITTGEIFITRNGKSVDRSNIWAQMKALCEQAQVSRKKVFPHNLRHLFARTFYSIEKDIAKLADILGHSSVDTTRLYIISSGKEHRQQMERLHLVL